MCSDWLWGRGEAVERLRSGRVLCSHTPVYFRIHIRDHGLLIAMPQACISFILFFFLRSCAVWEIQLSQFPTARAYAPGLGVPTRFRQVQWGEVARERGVFWRRVSGCTGCSGTARPSVTSTAAWCASTTRRASATSPSCTPSVTWWSELSVWSDASRDYLPSDRRSPAVKPSRSLRNGNPTSTCSLLTSKWVYCKTLSFSHYIYNYS